MDEARSGDRRHSRPKYILRVRVGGGARALLQGGTKLSQLIFSSIASKYRQVFHYMFIYSVQLTVGTEVQIFIAVSRVWRGYVRCSRAASWKYKTITDNALLNCFQPLTRQSFP